MVTLALKPGSFAHAEAVFERGKPTANTPKAAGNRKSKQRKPTATTTIVQQFVCLRETLAFRFKETDVLAEPSSSAIMNENAHRSMNVSCGCNI